MSLNLVIVFRCVRLRHPFYHTLVKGSVWFALQNVVALAISVWEGRVGPEECQFDLRLIKYGEIHMGSYQSKFRNLGLLVDKVEVVQKIDLRLTFPAMSMTLPISITRTCKSDLSPENNHTKNKVYMQANDQHAA